MENAEPKEEKMVLIVDDDRHIGELLRAAITDQTEYRVVWIAESDLALEAASHLKPAVIVLDYVMPTLNGLKLFEYLQEIDHLRKVPVVLISGQPSLPVAQLQARGLHVLRKPFDIAALLQLLDQLAVQADR